MTKNAIKRPNRFLRRPRLVGLCATTVIVASITAAMAVASSGSTLAPKGVVVAPMSHDVAASVAAFRTPLADQPDGVVQGRLRDAFRSAPSEIAEGHVDFDLARPSPVAGGGGRVWIAPAGNEICTFIPDPTDGVGASCAPLDAVRAGRAITVLGGRPGSPADDVIVAVVVTDDAAPPTLVEPDGHTVSMTVRGNVAAVRASRASKISTSAGVLDLAVLGRYDADPAMVGGN